MDDVEQDLLETMAASSETGVEGEFPRIRNLRKIPDEKSTLGHTFEFEAFVEGEWREYGPVCCGNWTCLRGLDCLPDDSTVHWNRCFPENRRPNFRTIGIGVYSLNRLYNLVNSDQATQKLQELSQIPNPPKEVREAMAELAMIRGDEEEQAEADRQADE